MSLRSLEELPASQACKEFSIWVKALVKTRPLEEEFDLIDQPRRSARSAWADLEKGYGRNKAKDNGRSCKNAVGSLPDTLDHMTDAHECEYIRDHTLRIVRARIEKALKITRGYMRYLYGNDPISIFGPINAHLRTEKA